jgi:hypothetical protein
LDIPGPLLRALSTLPFVISTEAQRSGEICGFSGLFLEMFFTAHTHFSPVTRYLDGNII